MNKVFFKTYQFIAQNRMWSLIGLIVICAGLIFMASRIQFEEDISKLIPSNSKSLKIQKVLKSINFTDKIIVNIKRQSQGNVDDLTQYASQLIDSIYKSNSEYVKDIKGKIEDVDIETTLDFLYNNSPLFLNETDYESIRQKLSEDSIKAITKSNYKTIISPAGIVAKESILKDPFGIAFLGLQKLQRLGFGEQFILKNGYLLSKDEKNLLLFISPTYASSETAKNAKFANDLYAIQSELNYSFRNKVESEYFGAVLIAVANAKQIKKDIQFTVGIALILLMIIFIVFYRRITIPLILFAPTVFGALISIAFLYLIREQFSAISLGIGSVLLGVTLDYSLHILTHLRSNGSVESLFRDITKPILMSSLTTALAFLCLLFLDSQVLQDLGIFAAVSVFGASIFALIFIPQVYRGGMQKKVRTNVIDRIAAYDFHKNKWFIGIVFVVVILSLFTYNNVIFNKDITKLHFEPTEATIAKQNLDALTHLESKSIYLAVYGQSMEEALKENESIFKLLEKLKKQDDIIGFSSIGGIVFSEASQNQKISNWKDFWNTERVQSTKKNLIESGAIYGFKPSTHNRFFELLYANFKPIDVNRYSDIAIISLDDFITEDHGFTTITSLIKVDSAKAKNVRAAFKNRQNTLVIDRQEMNETLLGTLKTDFHNLMFYSLIVVILILFLFFKSISLTVITAFPIFLTWFITVGLMGLFGIEFNIFNIIISTFIFGLGVDYSIFITNGLLKENQIGQSALTTYRTSIILSVITTILGVGVLIFAKHPAMYSISLIALIGIFSALFISLTIQPLLFRLLVGSNTKRPTSIRLLFHSVISFSYYGLGGLVLSIFSGIIMKLIPLSKETKMRVYHRLISRFMWSVLFSNPFVRKDVINEGKETFEKPGIIIANHSSFLDILIMGSMHPKMIFLVNDWVYYSPIFGRVVRLAGFYPVSGGIEKGLDHLRMKVAQGYSLMVFPEGSRSKTNKIRRFHKGAFYLAKKLNLDIIPMLIHGNSELLAKGSFIIRKGSTTIKILDRISNDDYSFGRTDRERTKGVGLYFKKEFQKLRDEIEHETYFHKMLRLDYRFKGDGLYDRVKQDILANAKSYKMVLDKVGKKDVVVNLITGEGQLDFLLMLDSSERTIYTYIENESSRNIARNSFIPNRFGRISFCSSRDDALNHTSDIIILNTSMNNGPIKGQIGGEFLGFQLVYQDNKLSIFKKNR